MEGTIIWNDVYLETMQRPLVDLVRNILNTEWDPIGITSVPIEGAKAAPDDEYDMYIPDICAMLEEQRSAIDIVQNLLWVEVERMGLTARMQEATRVANLLIQEYQGFAAKKE